MAANRPLRGAETEVAEDSTQSAAAHTPDSGLVKWLLVGTTLALLVANILLWAVELGKYSA